jgi:hypothetical protein
MSNTDLPSRSTSLLERMGDMSALQVRVQIPAKRERESARPNDDDDMAKRRRRTGKRTDRRRNQATPITS